MTSRRASRGGSATDAGRTVLSADLIVAHAPDPVFVVDLEGKIHEANAAVSQLLGLRRDEILEQSVSRFLGPAETQEFVAAVREAVEQGVARNVRLHPRCASGDVIPTTLNASALRDPGGKVIGAIGILRDMRAHERVLCDLEESQHELSAANQAKDQFLAMVSHELRTPLTPMLGWARLLRTGMLDHGTAAQGLEVIERNTRLLAQLIDDLLDVSRIVTGKLRLELRRVDPIPVLEAAIAAVQPLADARSISLTATLDPSAGPLLGDSHRLQQVVWNLLSNAIKFTPPHGRVDLRLERAGVTAHIVVHDTGKGIRPELLPEIFERFRQGEETRGASGLGLGLSIVRHITELHRGTVRAESPGAGRGATFTVELPLLTDAGAADPVATLRVEARGVPSLTSLAGVRILVVDDEADAREVVMTILRQAGAEVRAGASVPEALAILDRWRPDVLVSDLAMPGEDGCALVRRVRQRGAGRADSIPALALSAYTRPEDRAQALAAGFQMHLAKPVDPAEVTALVASLAAARDTQA